MESYVTQPTGNSLSSQIFTFIGKQRHLKKRFTCLDELGDYVMWKIFFYLSYKDLKECEKVCVSWKRILDGEKGFVQIWREMLSRRVSYLSYFA